MCVILMFLVRIYTDKKRKKYFTLDTIFTDVLLMVDNADKIMKRR